MANQKGTQICTYINEARKRVTLKRHKNPDGSVGGFVASDAKIHRTATVEMGGMVLPGGVVKANDVVRSQEVVNEKGRHFLGVAKELNLVHKNLKKKKAGMKRKRKKK